MTDNRAQPGVGGLDVAPFGQWQGRDVQRITLRTVSGLCAQVLTWGAVLQDLRVPLAAGPAIPVTLGFASFDPYPDHSPYFGAVIGRYANRIASARFDLAGRRHDLSCNEGGTTTLHGGAGGFSQRLWQIIDGDSASVTLGLDSSDGDQGFPGRVAVRCTYALGPGLQMRIRYHAQTDAATPLNMTQHSYFNLDGSPDLRQHQLMVHADAYTPVDERAIPTGGVEPVTGTRFDHRSPRAVGTGLPGLDHNFVLTPAAGDGALRPAAALWSVASGLRMRVATTKPGLQIYDGHKLAVAPPGLDGRAYGRCAGLCLEPQFFPNSPNTPAFPDSVLRPGATYAHETVYAFDYLSQA